jgi:hypothetical protein
MAEDDAGPSDRIDVISALRRWEDFGGSWRVLSSDPAGLIVSLCRCDGGEEVERLRSADPALAAFIGQRRTNGD